MARVNAPFFEIHQATVWRGETAALRDFSLCLHLGESVAILGPNGAGKSTLLKLLTGEVRPEANPTSHCLLFDEALWSLDEIRHRIGIVMPEEVSRFQPEEPARDCVLSALRGSYGRTPNMRFSTSGKSRALEAMALMGVAALAARPFGSLSSGERRRFLIARALVHNPEVLVLDEPFTALDFGAVIQLTAHLQNLSRHGRTLVLVTHHPGEIPPEIRRVVLLKHGKVFADGPKRQILNSKTLGELYGEQIRVHWSAGWCDARPGMKRMT